MESAISRSSLLETLDVRFCPKVSFLTFVGLLTYNRLFDSSFSELLFSALFITTVLLGGCDQISGQIS